MNWRALTVVILGLCAAAAVAAYATTGRPQNPGEGLNIGAWGYPQAVEETSSVLVGRVPPGPLRLEATIGGDINHLLAYGNVVYVPAGRGLSVWDYGKPDAPRLLSTTSSAPGVIHGLARYGMYLYASWREESCRRGGLVVYSIADPKRPSQLGVIAQYAGNVPRTCAAGIAVAKGRLYLFDTENGLYVGRLTSPRRPTLKPTAIGNGVGAQVVASGSQLWAGGQSLFGGYLLRSIDISLPDSPRETAVYSSPGTDIFNVAFHAPYAFGFGHKLSVLDMSDAQQIQMVGSAEMRYGAMIGMKLGQHVYTGGFHGLDVWSISDPTHPTFIANHDLRTFSARRALPLRDDLGLLLGTDDRLLAIDAQDPDAPKFASQRFLAGGVKARDLAFVDEYVVLLQYDYGITVADPTTLQPLARLEPKLPDDLQARAYTAMKLQEKTAYLAVWGYGLIVVDLSTPLRPREIARLPYPSASSIEVEGDRVYLGKNTNGPMLGVIDVSDPSNPVLLSNWLMPDAPWAIAAYKTLLFTAEAGTSELKGGVRVIDATDPLKLVQLARWDTDCDSATGLFLDEARARLYVACRRGLRILDVANPEKPRLIGATKVSTEFTFAAVAARGSRAWFGSGNGIEEYDVSVPSMPRLVHRTAIAGYEPIQLRKAPDERLLVTTYSAGVQILTSR